MNDLSNPFIFDPTAPRASMDMEHIIGRRLRLTLGDINQEEREWLESDLKARIADYKTKWGEPKKETKMEKKYVICRTYSAGVFAGYLESQVGQEVVMSNARRIWRWAGAASLSQLAVDGTSKPDECKFPCEVASIKLLQAIEILDATEKSRLSIAGVPVWSE